MTNSTETTFTAEEGLEVQKHMRTVLGLGPEAFPLPAFVGMISDEIEQLRAAGKTLSSQDIAEHYAPPEQRHFGE